MLRGANTFRHGTQRTLEPIYGKTDQTVLSKRSVAQTAENYTHSSKMRRVLSRTQIQTGGKPGLGRFFFHIPGIYLPPASGTDKPQSMSYMFLQTYQRRPWPRHQTATQSPHTLNSPKPLKPLTAWLMKIRPRKGVRGRGVTSPSTPRPISLSFFFEDHLETVPGVGWVIKQ